MKFYEGDKTELAENEVFVFGSNEYGFHGAGAAGFASFNVPGNVWRMHDYALKPNGWKGKWNVKGVGEGFQEGEIGKSYAIPTVTRAGAKRSKTLEQIKSSVKRFYEFARSRPDWTFFVAQGHDSGLNGYAGEEMAGCFAVFETPDNVMFKKEFLKLIKSHGK